MAQRAIESWGRLTHELHAVEPLADREQARRVVVGSPAPALAYGNGRSYGDVCLNAGGTLWFTRGLDRFVAFDAATGLIDCEAGVTLGEIARVALPLGWFLPVTPGTQHATLGGAIANDVHGKNHHGWGNLGHHVRSITLLRTDGTQIDCSPGERPDWFAATVGGLGLTGVVVRASLQLRPVKSEWIEVQTHAFETLEQFYALSAQLSTRNDYCVSWIDGMSHRGGHERGVLFAGNHAPANVPGATLRRIYDVPITPPCSMINVVSTRLFNSFFYRRMKRRPQAVWQHYRPFFYPLDAIAHSNRLYGPGGLYQFQCVVPRAVQLEATRELLRLVAESGAASFLSVLKTFGDKPSIGMLSFPMPGTTLALDFSNRGAATLRLLERLADAVAQAGGRLYAAKDATMSRADFERGYPRHAEFAAFRDPHISSELSRRLMGT